MLRRLLAGLILPLLAAFALPARADDLVPTTAKYAIIMDYDTGVALFEKDADVPTAPASMSKLMTVAIVFDRLKTGQLKLTDEFAVSERAWREREGSSMWVRVNTRIKVADLLRGIIVQSGNDACIVVAENIAGSEAAFADLMTKKAREWGLNNSTFANASGLPDPRHMMSMRDIALLSRKLIRDYPELYRMFAEKEFTWEGIRQPNRNPLLATFPGADGLKTGHTGEAGYGLAGSAVQNGARRIIVFHGTSSEKERSQEAQRLMRIAFNDFENKTLFRSGQTVTEAAVFKGVSKSVPLAPKEPVTAILHRSVAKNIAATVIYEGPVKAPIAEGQEIGILRVTAPGGDAREYPLYAAAAVKEINALGKIGLAARLLLAPPPKAPAAAPGAALPAEQP